MRWLLMCAAAMLLSSSFGAAPAHAGSPLTVTFGTSWDGPGRGLQDIVDAYLGTPGAIDVQADYVGAHPGDLDPWFWVGSSVTSYLVREIAGNAGNNELGWYREDFTVPVIDGVDDGVVFTGSASDGVNAENAFPSGSGKFGFYLRTHQSVFTATGASEQVFFTNRKHDDAGPAGAGAQHAPFDGDVQALVFDVSEWKGPNTWLVCFEDRDSGLPIGECCDGTDNDFNDLVFEVRASGATPVRPLSFGALKVMYR